METLRRSRGVAVGVSCGDVGGNIGCAHFGVTEGSVVWRGVVHSLDNLLIIDRGPPIALSSSLPPCLTHSV